MPSSPFFYKLILLISIYLGFLHFISVPAFPPFIVVMVAWVVIVRNLNDDGRYVKYGFPTIFVDYLFFTFGIGVTRIPELLMVAYVPLLLMTICWIFMFLAVRNEVFYFKRTIQSMNAQDRKKAVKALHTKDPADFQDVARYVDWNYVS